MIDPSITLHILPGSHQGKPPMVRVSTSGCLITEAELTGTSDTALAARAALSAMAYLFAQGQPVEFGPEVPLGVLK